MTKEALKLALEALEYRGVGSWRKKQPAIAAIKEALAQPEQEPVAWKTDDIELYVREDKFGFYNIPLYTHPPQRKPLTDEEIIASNYPDGEENGPTIAAPDFELICFARAIEAAHGIEGEA